MASCSIIFGDATQNEGGKEPTDIVEGAIYSKGSTLGFLSVGNLDYTSSLSNALALKTHLKIASESGAPYENEVVIGISERAVSKTAYEKLSDVSLTDEMKNNPDDCTRWLIYTDGKSVAVAYDENEEDIALRSAIDYFIKNLVKDTLILDPGVVSSDVVSITAFKEAEDEAQLNVKWQIISTLTGNGEKIAAALKDLYTLYGDDTVDWLAGLYEPSICQCSGDVCIGGKTCGTSGFYYSNSARDNEGYLPDVESTNQTLSFLEKAGMTNNYAKTLPKEMLDGIGRYVLSIQDPDGYFYHPLWGKNVFLGRKSRDLMWSENILKNLGLTPIYDTPNGTKGSGAVASSVALTSRLSTAYATGASSVVSAASTTDPNLVDDVSFKNYLNRLDVKNNSYSAGNTLAAYFNTIRSRNNELKRQGVDYDLIDIMIEHLNDAQNKDTGTWYYVSKDDPNYSGYYAVNGVMKISCVYEAAKVAMPNADKAMRAAVDAITSDEELGACVDIYNTWFSISNIFSILSTTGNIQDIRFSDEMREELHNRAPELIKATKEKLAIFKKPDGSFSYTPKYSADKSQGSPAAVPNTEEGDVNATVICVTGTTSLIYSCLGIADMVPIYTRTDYERFIKIAMSDDEDSGSDVTPPQTDDEARGSGNYKDSAIKYDGTTATQLAADGKIGTSGITFDPESTVGYSYAQVVDVNGDKALELGRNGASTDPYLYVPYTEQRGGSSYVFETDFSLVSGSESRPNDNQIFSIYLSQNSSDSIFWGGAHFHIIATDDGYSLLIPTANQEGSSYEGAITAGEWYNFRMEIEGLETGSLVKYYVNGTLIHTSVTTRGASAASHMLLRFNAKTTGQIYLDNTYFAAKG